MRKFRGCSRPFLAQPTLHGALLFVTLSAWSLAASYRTDDYEGADAAGVRQFLSGEYHGEVLKALGLVLALSALLGLAVGFLVGWAVRTRQSWLDRNKLEPPSFAWRSLSALVFTYAVVWLDDVIARPALYQSSLYAKRGALAGLQVTLTQHLGRAGLWLCVLLVVAAWLLLPLARRPDFRRPLRRLGLFVGIVGGLVFVAVMPWRRISRGRAQAGSAHPNVIIIAADSLRPDHIRPNNAPRMSALTKSGLSFEHAYAPLARTFPAWVSILTGQYPHHHGVRNMFPRWETRQRDYQAIPSSFRAAGYLTAVISDFAGDIFRRIDLGFSRIQAPTFTMRELLRERILKQNLALLPWLRGPLAQFAVPVVREMSDASDAETLTRETLELVDNAGEQPFFITVFYSTTHFPYAAPSPYYKQFVKPNYRGPYRYAKADTLVDEGVLTEGDIEQVRGLFDGAIAAVDASVGALLDGLTSRGLMDRTIIVLTADHGEGLYENGRGQGHGDHLYGEESIRVPFVIAGPHMPRGKVNTPVSSIDLAPTLCELAKVSCSPNVDGRSLAVSSAERPPPPRPVFSETGLWFTETIPEIPFESRIAYPELVHLTEVDRAHSDEIVIRKEWEPLTIAAKYRMIRDERYKLIYMPTRMGPRLELFDTLEDPAEVLDIAAKKPEIVDQLKLKLVDWILNDVTLERRGDIIVPRVRDGKGGADS